MLACITFLSAFSYLIWAIGIMGFVLIAGIILFYFCQALAHFIDKIISKDWNH